MALVFVAKDMQVTNPVGHINIHPLPELPAGLTHAHLLRLSLSAMGLNLVDGSSITFSEYHRTSEKGIFEYTDTSVFSNWGSSGWAAPEWPMPYKTGLTWMAVGDWPPPWEEGSASARIMSSGDYINSNSGMLNINIQSADGRVRIGGTDIPYTSLNVGEPPTTPFMVFGTANGIEGRHSLCLPHSQLYKEGTFTVEEPVPDIQGLTLTAGTANASYERHVRLYMIAQWGRELPQAEMINAYNALKPWLLARGVAIA